MNKLNYLAIDNVAYEIEDKIARKIHSNYIPNTLEVKWIDGIRLLNGVESTTNASTYTSTDFIKIPFGFDISDFYTGSYAPTIFFYNENKEYISTAIANGTIPSEAVYMRLTTTIASIHCLYESYGEKGGKQLEKFFHQMPIDKEARTLGITTKKSLLDVIYNPLIANPIINFTGDSNTYGHGVEQKSWAYYLAKALKDNFHEQRLYYYVGSPYVQAQVGIQSQSLPVPMLKGYTATTSESFANFIRIKTNATTLYYGCNTTLSSENHVIFVDGVLTSGVKNTDTEWYVTLDGNNHEVKFMVIGNTSLVNPYFSIAKAFTFNNYGVSGRNSMNVSVNGIDTCDLYIVMIGTNDVSNNVFTGNQNGYFLHKFSKYIDKCVFVEPIYSVNMKSVAHLIQTVEIMGGNVLKMPYLNALMSIHETDTMQSDSLHFTTKGHLMICNAISDELGFPTNLSLTYTEEDTVGNVFTNLAS